jgi:hypothetical protein
MENFHTVEKYSHELMYDPLFEPVWTCKTEIQAFSRGRFWPNLQLATVHEPFMVYGKYSYSKEL